MHPRIQEAFAFLDARRADLRAALDRVPPSRHAEQPAPGRWSAAEVMEHLGLVETRIAASLARLLSAARAAGLGLEREVSSIRPMLDVDRLLDRRRGITTGESAEPRGGLSVAESWAVLDRAHASLTSTIGAADGLALGEVSAPHPALGVLNVYQWLLFVGAHEGRHAAQIREVAAALGA